MQNLLDRLTPETSAKMTAYSIKYPSTVTRLERTIEGLDSYLLLTLEDVFTLMSICGTKDIQDINTMFN